MQVKSNRSNDEKIRKQYAKVKIGFLRQGTSLIKFCAENGIDRTHAFRVLKDQRTGEAAQKLKQRLIDASKGKVTQ